MGDWIDELDYMEDERTGDTTDVEPGVDGTESEEEFVDTLAIESKSAKSDNVGGSSVELDVEQLLAEVEAEAPDGVDTDGRVRRKLEAIVERKRRHEALVDFDEYDLDS
jgi:hypothetical protein